MVKGPRLLEERVVQNNVMGVLNPSSVNTVRCITLNTMDGIVAFLHRFIFQFTAQIFILLKPIGKTAKQNIIIYSCLIFPAGELRGFVQNLIALLLWP